MKIIYTFYFISAITIAYLIDTLNMELIGLCLLIFLLRLSFIDLPADEDTAFYTYLGHFQGRGVNDIDGFWCGYLPIYKTISFLYRLFGKSLREFRLFDIYFNIITLITTYHFCSLFIGPEAALWAGLLYAVISSDFYLSVYSFNTEKYYYFFHILGLSSLSYALAASSTPHLFLSGMLMAVPIAIKIVPVVQFAIFFLFLAFSFSFTYAAWFLLGGLVIALFVIFYFIFKPDLTMKIFIEQHQFRLNAASFTHKISDLSTRYLIIGKEFKLIFRNNHYICLLALPMLVYLYFFSSSLSSEVGGGNIIDLLLLFLFGNIIVLVGTGVFHSYHYIPVTFSLGLLIAISISQILKAPAVPFWISYAIAGYIVVSLIIQCSLILRCRFDKEFKKRFLNNGIRRRQYFYVQPVADYVKENTSEEDRIFVWGLYSQIYTLSDRRGVDGNVFRIWKPYTDITIPIFDSMLKGIIEHKPKMVILSMLDLDMDRLSKFTGLDYKLDRGFLNMFRVYRFMGHLENKPEYRFDASIEEKRKQIEILTQGPSSIAMDDYYLNQKDYDFVFQEVDNALELNPCDMEVLLFAGYASWVKEDFWKAKSWFKAVERINPNFAGLSWGKGLVLRSEGKNKEALESISKELKTNRAEWINYEMGLTLQRMGRMEEAKSYLLTEGRLYSGKPEVNYLLGLTFLGLKEFDRARERFKMVIYSTHEVRLRFLPASYFHLGKICDFIGNREEAKENYQACLDLNPDHKKAQELPEVNYLLGSALLRLKEFDRAREQFKMVISSNHETRSSYLDASYFHLGEIYDFTGNRKEAKENYQACLDLNPDHKKAREQLDSGIDPA